MGQGREKHRDLESKRARAVTERGRSGDDTGQAQGREGRVEVSDRSKWR